MGNELLVTIEEAAHRLALGRTMVYDLVSRGQIASLKLGRARRIPVAALERFVRERLAQEEEHGQW